MSPKRLTWLLLLGVLLGCAAWGAGRLHAWSRVFAFHPHGVLTVDSSVHRTVVRTVERVAQHTIERVAEIGVSRAEAQERLRFRPVPPESVSQFERRTRRSGVTEIQSDSLIEPAIPPEPAIPEPPSIPPTAAGKSGNITRLGSDIRIAPDQVVIGDVVALGGDVVVEGHVEGDVAAMGGDVYLKSTARVDGDVVCMGGKLNEESGATVGGQRVSGMGARRHKVFEESNTTTTTHEDRSNDVVGAIIWLGILLGLAWGFSGLGPGRTLAAVETLRREPLMSLGIGALVFALIIPSIVALCLVVAILCITIIGIPFALAALLGYALFLCLLWGWGFVVAAAALGSAVLGRMAASAATAPAGASGFATPVPVVAPPTLMKAAIVGVLVLGGSHVAGEMLHHMGPLSGLGTLIGVLSFIAGLVAVTIGSGAWLRTEIRAGTMARWWRGTQWGSRSGQWGRASAPPAGAPHPAGGSTPTGTSAATSPMPSAGADVWTGSTPPSTPGGTPPYAPPPAPPPAGPPPYPPGATPPPADPIG